MFLDILNSIAKLHPVAQALFCVFGPLSLAVMVWAFVSNEPVIKIEYNYYDEDDDEEDGEENLIDIGPDTHRIIKKPSPVKN